MAEPDGSSSRAGSLEETGAEPAFRRNRVQDGCSATQDTVPHGISIRDPSISDSYEVGCNAPDHAEVQPVVSDRRSGRVASLRFWWVW